jgi:CubicO group peptidase (beta-lactamase class C family)
VKQLDGVIDAAIAQERIVGTVVLIARNGEIIYRRAAGFADRESQLPVELDTLFRLASITKLVVSAAAMACVESGVLALDEPVTQWLPEFRPAFPNGRIPAVTVRHLLNHTAGLNYRFNESEDGPYHRACVSDGMDQPGLSIEENLRRVASAPLLFEPGTAWAYSVSHDILGEVLARAANEPLPAIVARTVTKPLCMNDAAFHVVERDRLAVPYADAVPRPVRMTDDLQLVPFGASALRFSPLRVFDRTSFPSGGTGLVGTAGDVLKILEAVRGGGAPILSAASARAMTTNAIGGLPVNDSEEGWRYGFGVSVLNGSAAASRNLSPGSWQWGGVYGNYYWVDAQKRISGVILTNTAVAGMRGEFPDAVRTAAMCRLC